MNEKHLKNVQLLTAIHAISEPVLQSKNKYACIV